MMRESLAKCDLSTAVARCGCLDGSYLSMSVFFSLLLWLRCAQGFLFFCMLFLSFGGMAEVPIAAQVCYHPVHPPHSVGSLPSLSSHLLCPVTHRMCASAAPRTPEMCVPSPLPPTPRSPW